MSLARRGAVALLLCLATAASGATTPEDTVYSQTGVPRDAVGIFLLEEAYGEFGSSASTLSQFNDGIGIWTTGGWGRRRWRVPRKSRRRRCGRAHRRRAEPGTPQHDAAPTPHAVHDGAWCSPGRDRTRPRAASRQVWAAVARRVGVAPPAQPPAPRCPATGVYNLDNKTATTPSWTAVRHARRRR